MIDRTAIALGFGQGILLLLMHEALQQHWPFLSAPELAYPIYAVILLLPIVWMLTFRLGEQRESAAVAAAMALVLVVLGFYAGHIAPEDIERGSFASVFTFALNMLLLSYIALPFLQSRLRQGDFSYPYSDLYEFGWLCTQVILLACLFTAMVWALLSLWAALFSVLDIKLFSDLFFDRYFAYPATGTMFFYGISLGLQRFNVGIVQKVDFLFRAVTVIVALIVVLFLAALLASGLQPLWDTGRATFLLLSLQLFIVVFVNGLFQQGDSNIKGAVVRWSMSLQMLAMPLFSAICSWALYLRVDQHGWTTDRVWAALIIVVLSMYALGYAAAAMKSLIKSEHNFSWIAGSNVFTALIVLLLLVLTNSPLLSPVRIAADSQVARLLQEKVAVSEFDFDYLRFDLGRIGLEKLKFLKQAEGYANAELIRARAEQALLKVNRWDSQTLIQETDIARLFAVYPADKQMDKEFKEMLLKHKSEWPYNECFSTGNCLILLTDLNSDAMDDAVIMGSWNQTLLSKKSGTWKKIGRIEGKGDRTKLRGMVKEGAIKAVQNPWKNLQAGSNQWYVVID